MSTPLMVMSQEYPDDKKEIEKWCKKWSEKTSSLSVSWPDIGSFSKVNLNHLHTYIEATSSGKDQQLQLQLLNKWKKHREQQDVSCSSAKDEETQRQLAAAPSAPSPPPYGKVPTYSELLMAAKQASSEGISAPQIGEILPPAEGYINPPVIVKDSRTREKNKGKDKRSQKEDSSRSSSSADEGEVEESDLEELGDNLWVNVAGLVSLRQPPATVKQLTRLVKKGVCEGKGRDKSDVPSSSLKKTETVKLLKHSLRSVSPPILVPFDLPEPSTSRGGEGGEGELETADSHSEQSEGEGLVNQLVSVAAASNKTPSQIIAEREGDYYCHPFCDNLAGWTEQLGSQFPHIWPREGSFEHRKIQAAKDCVYGQWGDPGWDYQYTKECMGVWEKYQNKPIVGSYPVLRAGRRGVKYRPWQNTDKENLKRSLPSLSAGASK